MVPQEIRLGNWLEVGMFEKQRSRVDSIGYKTIHLQGNLISNNLKDVKPISISLDWLELFGFKRTFYNKDSNYSEHELTKNGFTIKFTTESSSFSECYLEQIGIDIDFVHQLQNLYFQLTNEELTID